MQLDCYESRIFPVIPKVACRIFFALAGEYSAIFCSLSTTRFAIYQFCVIFNWARSMKEVLMSVLAYSARQRLHIRVAFPTSRRS
jgi:hypothetical protein